MRFSKARSNTYRPIAKSQDLILVVIDTISYRLRTSEAITRGSKLGDASLFQRSDDLVDWRARLFGSVIGKPISDVEGGLQHRLSIIIYMSVEETRTPGFIASGAMGSPLR